MSTYVTVARYHLLQRMNYLILPWAVLAFAFVVDAVILEMTPAGHSSHRFVGGLGSIAILVFVLGLQSVAQSLPFALALGLSRRSYFVGSALLAAVYAVIFGVVITVGQAIERGTGGWGLNMGFFRVPYLLNGSWYTTLLTSVVTLLLSFAYGSWFGLVYRRWGLGGLVTFVGAGITLLLLGAVVTTSTHAWHDLGRFFTDLSAAGLTGVVAALTVVLFVGGFATMRRLVA